MADILLVDFGTSRVKSVVASLDSLKVLDEAQIASPDPRFGPAGEVEVSAEAYWSALEATAGELATRHPQVKALWLCSELHGVIVADPAGVPITPYISWRDGRASSIDASGSSTFDRMSDRSELFFSLTGMKLRPGLPILSLAFLAAQNQLPDEFRLFTLPDWLLWRGGERDPGVHVSLAAGTGLYDLNRHEWSRQLRELAGLDGRTIVTPRIAPVGEVAGRIRLGTLDLPVFGCVGDVQSAAAGTGFPKVAKLVVNLGTGSQVLRSTLAVPSGIERRPGADGVDFAAITHIPSGRALSVFAELLDGSAKLGGGVPLFWSKFSQLSPAEVLDAKLEVDLNVFEAAWRYQHGGLVGGINEGRFSPMDLMAGVAKGWLAQYADAMDRLDPSRHEQTFLVTGGLSRRAGFIVPAISHLSGRKARLAEVITGEETLDGLLAMSCVHTPAI
jgi:FGGY family of carbohydrate kinases, N-terminal domain